MENLTTRFSPTQKACKKKLCEALAHALNIYQPDISELNGKLNITVAKILFTKYNWNVKNLEVYQAGNLVLLNANCDIERQLMDNKR